MSVEAGREIQIVKYHKEVGEQLDGRNECAWGYSSQQTKEKQVYSLQYWGI